MIKTRNLSEHAVYFLAVIALCSIYVIFPCAICIGSDANTDDYNKNPESQSIMTWREPFSGMEFVKISGGCFQMGQTPQGKHQMINERGRDHYQLYFSDEPSRHQACVGDFWLGRFEITNGQFRLFRPEHTNPAYEGQNINGGSQPAVNISWKDAQDYARWLSQKTGLFFRLPTEVEWEYGCRAKTATVRFWGDDSSDACQYSNTHDLASEKINKISWQHHVCDDGHKVAAPVGSFKPNGFGLYDMLGNVWEWCLDVYQKESKQPMKNKSSIAHMRDMRIIRGGSWVSAPAYVRCAVRYRLSVGTKEYIVGFRFVAER